MDDMVSIKPLVSVIVPNYNYEAYLDVRMESILAQTYDNFEVIFLDDCSSDGSLNVIEKYKNNPHLKKIVCNDANSGSPFVQWEKGLGLAEGEYVWIAESDDFCSADFLEKVMAPCITDPLCTLSFSASEKVDEKGVSLGIHPNQRKMHSIKTCGRKFAKKYLSRKNCVVNASSAVFKRSAALSLDNGYDGYRGLGDQVFWAGLALLGNVAYTEEPLNSFRFHSSNVTAGIKTTMQGLKETALMANYLRDCNIADKSDFRYHSVIVLYSLKYRSPKGPQEVGDEIKNLLKPDAIVKIMVILKRIKRLLLD